MSNSIFSAAVRTRVPSAQPRGDALGSNTAAPATRRSPPPTTSTDAQLVALLEAPLHPGETAAAGFARKEAELRAAFAALSVLESRALHARLSNPRAGDELAAAFARMIADRRARLINFLADARRREALRSAGNEGSHGR